MVDRQNAVAFADILSLAFLASHRVAAQLISDCSTDREVSTLVGAGLGAAGGAIPATIVHRHDQASSHRILAVSISAGAVIGFVAAGRDHPCTSHADSLHVGDVVVARRSGHAQRGALVGAVIGGVVGAAGSTLLNTGCTRDPCDANRTRVVVTVAFVGEGALAGGILGSLIGWAWPVGR
jgi:hypothetical protein